MDSYYSKGGTDQATTTTLIGRDEVKARLKKFDSHTRAISKLVRENITYSTANG